MPIPFNLPPDETIDTREAGHPARIVHGCDYMLTEQGGLEFYYNFLDYVWSIDGQEIHARHYLDEPDTISFRVSASTLAQHDSTAILRFLQRRFTTISTLETSGYVVGWVRAAARP